VASGWWLGGQVQIGRSALQQTRDALLRGTSVEHEQNAQKVGIKYKLGCDGFQTRPIHATHPSR
jgi:hypothetical protein